LRPTVCTVLAKLRCGLVRGWMMDLKDRNIRVNILSPGTIDTPAIAAVEPELRAYLQTLASRGEIGRPEEIAAAVLFPASTDSSYVNGIELPVDGGAGQY